MKQSLNDMAVVLKCVAIAIVAALKYGCLAGIYRLIVRELMRKGSSEIPKFTKVFIGVNIANGILSLLAFARDLFESE